RISGGASCKRLRSLYAISAMSIKKQILSWLEELPDDDPIWSEVQSLREGGSQTTHMELPKNTNLPLFVYGALKLGMPAHGQLCDWIERISPDVVRGELWVRDGLPLLRLNGPVETDGFLLRWKAGCEIKGYEKVCGFEPKSSYQW